MKDFLEKELNIDDKVIFIYDKHKKNELKEGVIKQVNINQGRYKMALIQWVNLNGIEVESRAATHKIFKRD